MPFKSYAQNREDVILRRVFADVAKGTYVDIGAAWPELDSVTHAFYASGWRGVNVEPNEALHGQLVEARPGDMNLRAVVGSTAGNIEFFEVTDASGELTGLSTTDRDVAESWKDRGFAITHQTVRQVTLTDVLRDAGIQPGAFEFLKVDAEGGELEVLEGGDWDRWRPKVVVCEVADPLDPTLISSDRLVDFMLSKGYSTRLFDGLNIFFEDGSEPTGQSWAPVNIFDDYVSSNDNQMLELAISIEALQLEVAEAQRELADARAHLEWAKRRIGALDAEKLKFSTELASAHAYSHELAEHLQELQASRSWRVTAPLRRSHK